MYTMLRGNIGAKTGHAVLIVTVWNPIIILDLVAYCCKYILEAH